MTRTTRSPVSAAAGSPAYSPGDLPLYRGGSSGSTPIGCAITLTDISASVGGTPLTIAGQTVSYVSTGDGYWSAGQDLAYPIDWVGERIFENRQIVNPGNDHKTSIANSGLTKIIELFFDGTEWKSNDTIVGRSLGGTISQRGAIGVDGATGDVRFYINGVPVHTAAAFFTPGVDNIFIATICQGDMSGDEGSWEVITNGADMLSGAYAAGLLDWCGNDTIVP